MKPATIVFALVVAALLLVPTPVRAVSLPDMDRLAQPSALEQEAAETATPTEEAEDDSGIADLSATAGRLRGRVELTWSIAEGERTGNLVVERSTNGGSWRAVKACTMRFDPEQSDYDCTDTRLSSGATYSYRVCLTPKGSTCSNATPSRPVTVKAP